MDIDIITKAVLDIEKQALETVDKAYMGKSEFQKLSKIIPDDAKSSEVPIMSNYLGTKIFVSDLMPPNKIALANYKGEILAVIDLDPKEDKDGSLAG